jgi:hypothetical protein
MQMISKFTARTLNTIMLKSDPRVVGSNLIRGIWLFFGKNKYKTVESMIKTAQSPIFDIKRSSLSKNIIVTSPKRENYAFVLSVSDPEPMVNALSRVELLAIPNLNFVSVTLDITKCDSIPSVKLGLGATCLKLLLVPPNYLYLAVFVP